MRILLIDGSPLMYAQFEKVGFLKTSTGVPTGLRYGFLRAVGSLVKKLDVGRVVIVWDTPVAVKKALGRPEYKANRSGGEEKSEMYHQLGDLKELLSLTCYAQVEQDGFEADDVLGCLARKFSEQGHEILVYTPDHDMLQLVSERVTVIWAARDKKKKSGLDVWDREAVEREKGVGPKGFLIVKALLGDKSDNLKGPLTPSLVKRVIPFILRMENYLGDDPHQNLGCLEKALGTPPWVDSEREFILDNLNIMALHSPESVEIKKGQADSSKLRDLFEKLEFKSLVGRVDEFCTRR